MKRTILYTITTLCVALFSVDTLSAQQLFYAEEGEISNLCVERNNGEVRVTMSIDISNISLGRDETIIITPIVTDDEHKVTMPSIELMGRRAYIYYMRDGEKSETENPFTAQRIAKRAERREGINQVIDYEATFGFEEWMRGSKVAIREGLCGCGKLRGENEKPFANFGHNIYEPDRKSVV